MKYIVFLFGIIGSFEKVSGQDRIQEALLIFDSKNDNDPVNRIKLIDPTFFKQDYFWFVHENCSIWGLTDRGIKWKYDYDKKSLERINGIFEVGKKQIMNNDLSSEIEHNFYFGDQVIAWRVQSQDPKFEIIRYVDTKSQRSREIYFSIPERSKYSVPVILDTNRLLLNSTIIHHDSTLFPILYLDKPAMPSLDDRVFMRNNFIAVDRYFDRINVTPRERYPLITFFSAGNERLTALNPEFADINRYRLECNFGQFWLLSHKKDPNKFVLFNIASKKHKSFFMDGKIFSKQNLSVADVIQTDGTRPPMEVNFFHTITMTAHGVYFFFIKDSIKVYKLEKYLNLME